MEMLMHAKPLRVFVVDDSPLIRDRIDGLIGSIAGAEVVGHAESADDAIRGIFATQPDAVVLDLILACGTGLDVLRAVRATAPDIDVYLLTNHTAEPYRRAAERLGARGFFDKTTEFRSVRQALAGTGSRHS
jgi:two-component system response regulator DevR